MHLYESNLVGIFSSIHLAKHKHNVFHLTKSVFEDVKSSWDFKDFLEKLNEGIVDLNRGKLSKGVGVFCVGESHVGSCKCDGLVYKC